MLTVSEVMTRRVVTASTEATFKEAVELLERNRVSGLPVVDRTEAAPKLLVVQVARPHDRQELPVATSIDDRDGF